MPSKITDDGGAASWNGREKLVSEETADLATVLTNIYGQLL